MKFHSNIPGANVLTEPMSSERPGTGHTVHMYNNYYNISNTDDGGRVSMVVADSLAAICYQGPRFNIEMISYQYMILRPSYLHNEIS